MNTSQNKKNQWGLIFLAVTIVIFTTACQFTVHLPRLGEKTVRGSGEIAQETRKVSDFEKVTLAVYGDMTIEIGEEQSLYIKGDEALLPYIETVIEDNALKIRFQENINAQDYQAFSFHLTVKSLDTILLAGMGTIHAPVLTADQFKIVISGAGDLEMTGLTANALKTVISGAGNVNIAEGSVGYQKVVIAGAGEYHTSNVQSEQTEITITGSGGATVWATETLKVVTTGGGDIFYYGDPIVDASGTGKTVVAQLEDK